MTKISQIGLEIGIIMTWNVIIFLKFINYIPITDLMSLFLLTLLICTILYLERGGKMRVEYGYTMIPN